MKIFKRISTSAIASLMVLSICGSVSAEDATPRMSDQVIQQEANAKMIVEQLKAEIEAAEQQEQLKLYDVGNSLGALEAPHSIAPLGLTKEFYRTNFTAGAGTLYLNGFKLAPDFLMNSLNDNPSDLTATAGSEPSNIVKTATALKNLTNATKAALPSNSNYYVSTTSSLTLGSPTDVFLALNRVNVLQAAEKVGSTWTIYTRITDTYNFEDQNYTTSNGVPSSFVTLANNYAVDAQDAGAIVPFQVTIYIQDTK